MRTGAAASVASLVLADEARRMTERAREAGVLALIDHELRFLPGRLKMRELLHDGEIGKVRHAKLTFRSDSRADVNRPWNWWADIKQGGGTLGAIGARARSWTPSPKALARPTPTL